MRPETETRPEPEIDNPAEIQDSMSAICEESLGATRSRLHKRRVEFRVEFRVTRVYTR